MVIQAYTKLNIRGGSCRSPREMALMRYLRNSFSVLVFVILISATLAPAIGVQAEETLTGGTVISLQGTPHLWFVDEEGVLHWGGDTRALAGRQIDWSKRVEVSAEELKALEIGDPWLSTGLLKEGDPIYLAKWETEWIEPQLLHIQSLSDVELFGIDSSNYGNYVLGRATWEAEYGLQVDDLERSTLVPATTPTSPTPERDSSAPVSREAVIQRIVSKFEEDDDDDDLDDDTETATATATATGTGDQTATATATATDDGTSVTHTETDDTPEGQNVATTTATDTATATGTGDQTATATATATDDGTSVTHTETDDTPESQNVATTTATDTATATGTGDLTATATATATDDGTSVTHTETDETPDNENVPTATATATATATGTGDLTATATATATDDGTSATQTGTDDTPPGQNVSTTTATDTATATATGDQTATATATATDDGTSVTVTDTDPTDDTPIESGSEDADSDDDSD